MPLLAKYNVNKEKGKREKVKFQIFIVQLTCNVRSPTIPMAACHWGRGVALLPTCGRWTIGEIPVGLRGI